MDRILEGIKISPYGNRVRTRSIPLYVATTAPPAVPVDTGISVNELITHTEVTMSFIVDVEGTRYVLYNTVTGSAITNPLNYDLRISRTSEFETASGDVSFSFWIDSTTLTVWYDYDFDTAIPTFERVALTGVDFFV